MVIFNFYRAEENWYLRIVDKSNGYVWDTNAAALAAAPTWSNSVIALVWSNAINGYPVVIPTTLPYGSYELQFYNAAVPAAADDVRYGEIYNNKYTHN